MIKPMIAGVLAAAQAVPAPPPPARPCITREQIGDVAVTVLPFFIDSARAHCGPYLPATAFILTSGGADMAAAMRRAAAPRRASAAAGFRIFAGPHGLRGVSEGTIIQMMGEGLAGELMPTFDAQSCRNMDDLLETISPLPPERIGHFAGVFFAMATAGRHHQEAAEGETDPEICRS